MEPWVIKGCSYYLCDDATLNRDSEQGKYQRVYLDQFVCCKHENFVPNITHRVVGTSNFVANATSFAFECPADSCESWIKTYLDGQYHLTYFVEKELVWAVKNLVIMSREIKQVASLCYLMSPKFMAAGFYPSGQNEVYGHNLKRGVDKDSILVHHGHKFTRVSISETAPGDRAPGHVAIRIERIAGDFSYFIKATDHGNHARTLDHAKRLLGMIEREEAAGKVSKNENKGSV